MNQTVLKVTHLYTNNKQQNWSTSGIATQNELPSEATQTFPLDI